MKSRTTALFAVLFVLLAGTVSVSAQEDETVSLTIGLHAAEKNFNPLIRPMAQPLTHDLTNLVYDTLFWSQASESPEGFLATGAESSDDARTWTITLREGVKWHDGEAFTADDVAFTFQFISDLGGPSRYGHHVTDYPTFVSAEVVDDFTVVLNFEDPIPTFKFLPGGDLPILPEHIWSQIDEPLTYATELPIGTGPFEMVEYVPDTSYRLVANEDYFLGDVTVDELIMPVVRNAQAAWAGLESGELDFVTRNVPSNLIDGMRDNPDLEIIEGSRLQSVYLMFNTRRPILNDATVRRAISMSLDLDVFVNLVEGGLARPGNDTWTHPDSAWAHPTGGHVFDVAAANTMLDDAGYTMGDDGVRVSPDGDRLEWTLYVNSFAPPQIRSGELVAEQVAAIGVAVTVESLDPAAISSLRRPGPDGPPNIDMFINTFEAHAHADPDALLFFFHSPGDIGVGGFFSGLADPEFDALAVAATELSAEERVAVGNVAVQEKLAELMPAVTLFYPDGRWAYRPAAYDGWVSDPGHGVFNKKSFIASYVDAARAAEDPPVADEAADTEDAPATEEASATEDAPTTDDAPTTEDAPADAETSSDDGNSGLLLAVAGAAVVLAGGAFFVRRKNARAGTVQD